MAPWSLLSGTSRLHEAPPSPGGLASSSGPDVVRRARRLALVGGALTVWSWGGALAALVAPHTDARAFSLVVGVAAIVLVLGALVAWRESRPTQLVSALAGTLFLVTLFGFLALASSALLALSAPTWLGGALGWSIAVGVGILAPLLTGARLVALERAFDASGKRAPGFPSVARAMATRDAVGAPRWSDVPRGAALAFARGMSLAGCALLDALLLPLAPRDRIHAEADLDALASALRETGATCEPDGSQLVVRLPPRGEGIAPPTLRLRRRNLRFPWLARRCHLEVIGDAHEARRFRAWLEGSGCASVTFSWSAPAVRIEKRLNAMLRESAQAATLEERGLLMEEANKLAASMLERDLNEEEHAILSTLKGQRLRGMLATRMLTEPPGGRTEGRVLTHAAAMPPPLANVLDAGGLSSVKRIVFVPHWIVPLRTPWGEQETLVNASTGKTAPHAAELLDAMRRRAPSHFHDAGSQAQFLPAPPATAALLRELRGVGGITGAPSALELVYVPFVPTAEGHVNAVTGDPAPDLGPVPGIAA